MSKGKLAGVIVAVVAVIVVAIVIVVPNLTSSPEPARFEVSSLHVSPEEAEPGQSVTITVHVQNIGERTGTHALKLMIDGLIEQSKNVTLDGGETTSVSFFVEKDIEGSYSVELAGLTETFQVIEPEQVPTPVGGVLSGDVVWTITESPYILTSNILVPEGSGLIIEPGTQVNLDDRFIQIEGTLQILGTSTQPVTITAHANIGYPRITFKPNSVGWDEGSKSGSIIRNAIIEGESYGYGLILVEGSSPKIVNSTVINTNPSGTAIAMPFGGSPEIVSNRIRGQFGLSFHGSGSPRIVDNRIEGHNSGTGISVYPEGDGKSDVRIDGNLITGFEYGVIVQRVDDDHHVSIVSNHITNNQIGVHTGDYDLTGSPPLIIRMNAIHNNRWNAQSGNFDVDMAENWWGSTDSVFIQASLYDYYEDFQRGHIVYEPFLMEAPKDIPLS